MLRWTKRISVVVISGVALFLVLGTAYEQWARGEVARSLPAPGQLIAIDGVRLHLRCSGQGSPAVILEAGTGPAASMAWTEVQPSVAEFTRVCSYDRAGLMWSDGGDMPRDAERIAADLHALLFAAAVSPPYVLVGHSIGSVYIRVFADRFPDEVVGLVFVDASHPDQWQRFPPELAQRARVPARARFIGPLLAHTGVLRMRGGVTLRQLPADDATIVNAYLPRSVKALLAESEAQDVSMSQARRTGAFDSLPLIVLSSGRDPDVFPPGVTPALQTQFRPLWMELQKELVTLSSNADHRVIEDSGHFIQIDAPEAVTNAVRDVVMAVRTGGSVTSVSRRRL
jgi:pimeloyl-ACP methyl ester carboxylesterase